MGESGTTEYQMRQRVGVIGLGYVGLPLALLLVEKGFQVLGIDLDSMKINKLAQGASYLTDISNQQIQSAILTKRFQASNDYSLIRSVDTVIICVPTPLSAAHIPDLTYLQQVGIGLTKQIRKGQLFILESSSYPGTTTEFLQPLLELSGYKVGKDIFLAYSPERIDPGNKSFTIGQIPKVLSGVTKECTNKAKELYSQVFNQVVTVSSPETAEFTKLVENCQRFINISFMNELAILCEKMNINIWEVIEAASTKPYGFTAYFPGPGIGGHCIPVDPLYLLWKAKQYGQSSQFVELSDKVNLSMPRHIVKRVKDLLSPRKTLIGAKILIYGVTYKRDVNDLRESSSIEILKLLLEEGVVVTYHDPYVPQLEVDKQVLQSIDLTAEHLQQADCVVILVDHSQIPIQSILDYATLVFDTRNTTKGFQSNAKVVRLGEGNR
jgi:UDP-N-acetyl-D-glucosamine dehydrogenase